MLLKIEQTQLEPHLIDTHDITDNSESPEHFSIDFTPLLHITDTFCTPSVHNDT